MAKRISKFEDFIAWQKARKLTADVYRASNEGAFMGFAAKVSSVPELRLSRPV